MIVAPIDVKCNKCSTVYEVSKNSIFDDYVLGKCTSCGSEDVKRIWGIGATDIAVGLLGNSKTNFSKGPTYHPSKFGKFKGTRIK